MFSIISDGACDFTEEQVKKSNIEVVPFYITFDGTNYLKEGIDIGIDEYFEKIKADKTLFPKTSQPNPQDYIDVAQPHLEAGKDIIILTVSSKLSGSYNSAVIASDTLKDDFPDRKIMIIDSLSATVGQALILREIIAMRDAGFDVEKATEKAKKIVLTTKIYFTLDTLEYLKKGGRVGPTTALVGGLLALKPVLQILNGEVSQLDSVRGQKRVIGLIVEGLEGALKGNIDKVNVAIGHIVRPDDVADFQKQVEDVLDIKINTSVVRVGVAIGAHAGPGGLVVAYAAKYTSV